MAKAATVKKAVAPVIPMTPKADPDAESADLYAVPSEPRFRNDAGNAVDFIAAEDLDSIVRQLIDEPDLGLGSLKNHAVVSFWKKSSGVAGGIPILGKLERPNALVHYYEPDASFILWVSASRCAEALLTRFQMTALVYHLLCHAEINEEGNPGLVRPDFVGFHREVEQFGLWRPSLKKIGEAIQLKLFEDQTAVGQ